jgi:hypothetical protein
MRSINTVFPLATLIVALTATWTLAAQPAEAAMEGDSMSFELMPHLVIPLILAVVFTVVGLVLFAICIWLIVKIAPFSVRKEIEEDQNTALGIIVGSMILGIAIILASALVG